MCYVRLVLVKRFLQLMDQLTCSMKGRTGNYFGTCKRKKGHGVKREENYWALSGEAKSIHSLPPRHGPLPTGELHTKYRITPLLSISFRSMMGCYQESSVGEASKIFGSGQPATDQNRSSHKNGGKYLKWDEIQREWNPPSTHTHKCYLFPARPKNTCKE